VSYWSQRSSIERAGCVVHERIIQKTNEISCEMGYESRKIVKEKGGRAAMRPNAAQREP
jgi:hypothetical protein